MSGHPENPETAQVEPLKGFDDYDVRLGDIMRGERATLGKSLLDVQRDLKIRATYIAAIENADPSAFESAGFIAGYVRSYARYLKLDPEWAFETFCREGDFAHEGGLGSTGGKSGKPARSRKPQAQGKSPKSAIRDPLASPGVAFLPEAPSRFSGIEPSAIGSVAVLAVLIGAIGFGGWSVLQEVQKVQFAPVEQTPGVLAQLDPVVSVPEVGEDGAGVDDDFARPQIEAFDRLYRPQALDVPVLTARDGPIATIDPGTLGVFAAAPALEDSEAPGMIAPSLEPESPDPDSQQPVQVVEAGPPPVSMFAVRPAWVRVRGADGTVVFEKILDAGERFELPQTEGPHTLRAGNAGSVYFTVGDQTYGPAGTGASVVREVVMSAEALPETYALADPEADADLARFTAVAEAQPAE